MATPKALDALKKTKLAIDDIKEKLELVVQRLNDDAFEQVTAQAQATVSLSIGTMKYMGARLQGLDHGRTQDDPLRQELNQMRKVLAAIKARNAAATAPNRPVAKVRDPPHNDSLNPPSKKAKTTGGTESLTKSVTNKAPQSKAGSKKKVHPKR